MRRQPLIIAAQSIAAWDGGIIDPVGPEATADEVLRLNASGYRVLLAETAPYPGGGGQRGIRGWSSERTGGEYTDIVRADGTDWIVRLA
jgi:hypothetical protein